MNFRIIIRILGFLLIVEGVAMLLALAVALFYGGSDVPAFVFSSLLSLFIGTIAVLTTSHSPRQITKREGFVIVTLVWVVFSFFGTLPYLVSGSIPNLTNAFFETMSGFTTTGSTILNDIEALPNGILFWRSLTHWLGGMGIIVLSLAFLPLFGIGGIQLFLAEVPGPTPDKLSPKIQQTAIRLWGIYILFTAIEALLLWMGGMSLFDGVCHAFATMATGGFSTKQASVAFWPSPFIQYVIIFFMFLAGTNFSLLYVALKGNLKRLFHDEEFKYYLLFVLGFTIIIFSGLLITTTLGVEQAFRDALFQVVSVITTTGFATTDYLVWKPVLYVLLFALFFFGGSAGSTGGGIKIVRIVMLLKNSYYELRRIIHPNAVIPVRFNKHSVDAKIITNVLAFFMFYLLVFFVSTILFVFIDPDLESAMGAVATCLGNIGPGLGNLGPAVTFDHVAPVGKWFLSFLMLLGRLELFTVLVLFTPAFWKE